ncbi:MAG: polysulfide reductase NrfD [Chloroflexota bacterium]|nr:polysulfide reductase NrfD [Chloroflexota bacterium]
MPQSRPSRPSLGLSIAGVVWVAALGLGLVGVVLRLATGEVHAGYGSYIPWGLWVAAYVYFIGLSAGAFLISALVYVAGVKRLERIGKLALFTALVTLFMALITIWFDIGHMERFWEVYVYGNPSSMMAWMVWLYTAYFLLIIAENWFALRADLAAMSRQGGLRGVVGRTLTFGRTDVGDEAVQRDRGTLRVLGTIGVPLAIAFHGGVGALFGVIAARPFWNSPIFPIAFIVGALASGGALITFVTAFFWPDRGTQEHRDLVSFLGRMVLALLALYLLLEWAEFSVGLYGQVPSESDPYRQIMTGPYWYVFWFVHVLVGALVPLAVLLLRPRSMRWVGAACGLIAAAFIAVRLNVVIPGLIIPELKGLNTAYVEPHLSFTYFPSLMEWLVLLFVVAIGVGIFYAGNKLLPLATGDESEVQR